MKSKYLKLLWVLVPLLAAGAALAVFSLLPRDAVYLQEGTVEITTYDCFAQASGTVETVCVQAGQQVRAGDVLATLDDSDLDSEVDLLNQTIEIQQARLEQLRTLPDTSALQAARRSAQSSAAAVQANLEEAQRVLANAQADLADQQALYDIGAISRAELDQYARAVDTARSQVSALRAQVSAAASSADAIQMPTIDQNAVAAAEAEIELTRLQIAELELQRPKYTLTAAQDGVVLRSSASTGATVLAGQSVFRLSHGADQYFVFYLPQDYVDQLDFGDTVSLFRAGAQEPTGQGEICFIDWQAVYPPEDYETDGNKNKKSVEMKARITEGGPFRVGETLLLRLETE